MQKSLWFYYMFQPWTHRQMKTTMIAMKTARWLLELSRSKQRGYLSSVYGLFQVLRGITVSQQGAKWRQGKFWPSPYRPQQWAETWGLKFRSSTNVGSIIVSILITTFITLGSVASNACFVTGKHVGAGGSKGVGGRSGSLASGFALEWVDSKNSSNGRNVPFCCLVKPSISSRVEKNQQGGKTGGKLDRDEIVGPWDGEVMCMISGVRTKLYYTQLCSLIFK